MPKRPTPPPTPHTLLAPAADAAPTDLSIPLLTVRKLTDLKLSAKDILHSRVVSRDPRAEAKEIRSHFTRIKKSITTETENPLAEFISHIEAQSAPSETESDYTLDDGLLGIRFDHKTATLQLLQTDRDPPHVLATIGNDLITLNATPHVSKMLQDTKALTDDDSAPLSTRVVALLLRYFLVVVYQDDNLGSQESTKVMLEILTGMLWGHLQLRQGQSLAKEGRKAEARINRSLETRSNTPAARRLKRLLEIKERFKVYDDRDFWTRLPRDCKGRNREGNPAGEAAATQGLGFS